MYGKLFTLDGIYSYIDLSMQQPIISILGKVLTSKFVLLCSTMFFVLINLFFIVLDITTTRISIRIVRC